MPDIIYIDNYEPVPPIFYSEKSKKAFAHCKLCGKELIESSETYLIEKAYTQDIRTGKRELIFEIVYCQQCLQNVRDELSEESRNNIDKFFAQQSQLQKRSEQLIKNKLFDVDTWLNNCIITNQDIDDCEEFQIYAICDGPNMLYYEGPYMISGKAMDKVVELLSNSTHDYLNDLMLDNIDLPPEMEGLINKRKLILI